MVPGEADAAVDLDAVVCDQPGGVGAPAQEVPMVVSDEIARKEGLEVDSAPPAVKPPYDTARRRLVAIARRNIQNCHDGKLTSSRIVQAELPAEIPFANVIEHQRSNGQAVITVKNSSPEQIEQMAESLNCQVEIQTLPLDDIYRIVVS